MDFSELNNQIAPHADAQSPLPSAGAQPRRVSLRSGMLGLLIAAVLFNGLAYPLIRIAGSVPGLRNNLASLLLGPLVTGIILGQIAAMAIWLVWSTGSFMKRLAVHWTAAAALVIVLICGVMIAIASQGNWRFGQQFSEVLRTACFLPILSLAAQLPLWSFRAYLGWRIGSLDRSESVSKEQPLSILDILSGTAVVAVSLALVRFMPRFAFPAIWMQMAVMGLGIVVTSFVILLPAMLLILRIRDAAVGAGLYFSGVVASLFGLILIISVSSHRFPPLQGMVTMVWGGLVFAATVAAPLFVWRACGYRLVWPKDARRA